MLYHNQTFLSEVKYLCLRVPANNGIQSKTPTKGGQFFSDQSINTLLREKHKCLLNSVKSTAKIPEFGHKSEITVALKLRILL